MNILFNRLYQDLMQMSEILIYGAGDYAHKVYISLKCMGLNKKVRLFVVTNPKNEYSDIDGRKIVSLDELDSLDMQETVVLVAVSNQYCHDIVKSLQELKFNRILLLIDYLVSESEYLDRIKTASFGQLFTYIGEWYVCHKVKPLKLYEQEVERASKAIEQKVKQKIEQMPDKKTIVFIVGDFKPRNVKIIGALFRKGYKIIVLGYGYRDDILVKKELSLFNAEYFQCSDIEELLYIAIKCNPIVYYFMPLWGDCSWAEVMIKFQRIFGKIVLSLYDVLNDGMGVGVSDYRKMTEKYCLENANGIVWRSFSKEFLEKKGFKFIGKSIQFLDYCGGYSIEEKRNNRKEINICFVTGVLSDFCGRNVKNSGYVQEASIEDILDVIGNRNDCVFHVFAGDRFTDRDKRICDMLEKKFLNFSTFYNVNHVELIRRLAEYDYGCFLFTGGKTVPDMVTVNGILYGSEYNNGICGKFFDYIDAGIPIIATRPIKLCEYLETFGIVAKMDLSSIDIEYLKENKMSYKENVKKAKQELLIDNQIQKLINFFNDL